MVVIRSIKAPPDPLFEPAVGRWYYRNRKKAEEEGEGVSQGRTGGRESGKGRRARGKGTGVPLPHISGIW